MALKSDPWELFWDPLGTKMAKSALQKGDQKTDQKMLPKIVQNGRVSFGKRTPVFTHFWDLGLTWLLHCQFNSKTKLGDPKNGQNIIKKTIKK